MVTASRLKRFRVLDKLIATASAQCGQVPHISPRVPPIQHSPRAQWLIIAAMPLLERQEQLETLTRCLDQARTGSGKLVLIAGEAGRGKSSLVEQFVSAHRGEMCILWGACDALDTPRALGPVHEIAAQTQMRADLTGVATMRATGCSQD